MSEENTTLRMSGENARIIILNCHQLMRRRFSGRPLWSLVGAITGHGSGYSIEICRSANLEPNQKADKLNLVNYIQNPSPL